MYESVDAVCPYYRRHSAKKIKCEGPGNCLITNSREETERHIKDVCGDFFAWGKCPIAEKLNEKYRVNEK